MCERAGPTKISVVALIFFSTSLSLYGVVQLNEIFRCTLIIKGMFEKYSQQCACFLPPHCVALGVRFEAEEGGKGVFRVQLVVVGDEDERGGTIVCPIGE